MILIFATGLIVATTIASSTIAVAGLIIEKRRLKKKNKNLVKILNNINADVQLHE